MTFHHTVDNDKARHSGSAPFLPLSGSVDVAHEKMEAVYEKI
jgi:hypothetical protein